MQLETQQLWVKQQEKMNRFQVGGCMVASIQPPGINRPPQVTQHCVGGCTWPVVPAPELWEWLQGLLASSARGHNCKLSKGGNFKHKSPFVNAMFHWVSPTTHSGAKAVPGHRCWHAAPLAVPAGLGTSTLHSITCWFKHLKQEFSFAFFSSDRWTAKGSLPQGAQPSNHGTGEQQAWLGVSTAVDGQMPCLGSAAW